MVMALAFDDAKVNLVKKEKTSDRPDRIPGTMIKFFGSRDNPELPHAVLNQRDSGRAYTNPTHFHIRDQFQVFTDGKGKLGKHDLAPNCVHFTRAYTQYGPLVSDPNTGLSFFALRAHLDAGGQHLPEEREQLAKAMDRRPWQVTRHFDFPAPASDTVLQEITGIQDEQGLAAYTLIMRPKAKTHAPDPAIGDGQYLVVLGGGLLHDGKMQNAPALVFVRPEDGPFQIHAGEQGLQALVLNFPQVKPRAAEKITSVAGFRKWQCTLCSFAYDEALGMPEDGISAGTRWQDVPDTWSCPDCSASKSDFQMIEV